MCEESSSGFCNLPYKPPPPVPTQRRGVMSWRAQPWPGFECCFVSKKGQVRGGEVSPMLAMLCVTASLGQHVIYISM